MIGAWMRTLQGRLAFVVLIAVFFGAYLALHLWIAAAVGACYLVRELRDFAEWWEKDRAAATTEAAQLAVAVDRFAARKMRLFDQDE